MSGTNENIAGDGKAIAAHERNRERPEEADHLPLKDEDGQPKSDAADD